MKNNLFKLLLIALLCFSLTLAFASCDILKDILPDGILPDDGEGDGECTEHQDADNDGLCDSCGDDIDDGSDDGETDDTDFIVSRLEAIAYESYTVAYDAKPHSIVIDETKLPSGVQVYYSTGTEYTKVGEYTVEAEFYYKGKLLEGATKSATLTITKANYDMSGISVADVT